MADDQTLASEALDAEHPFFDDLAAFMDDPAFQTAWESLDFNALATEWDSFTASITSYNTYHTRERQLWSIQLGKGSIPDDLDAWYRAQIPDQIAQYNAAFASAGTMLSMLSTSGFGTLLETYFTRFTPYLADSKSLLGATMENYFRGVGCSESMIEEFRTAFGSIGYDFINVLGNGSFANLQAVMNTATNSQVQLMQYTQQNGFSYLQGQCGPPAWAVTVSEILGYIGISISAWVIVIIIAVLIVLLIIACNRKNKPAWLQSACNFISRLFSLGF
ncbi:MAG: hypothetical protein JST22_05180 [Bacteroidetes bacterium]|nr:hypothetical protein [Bacteroidota bacterium]